MATLFRRLLWNYGESEEGRLLAIRQMQDPERLARHTVRDSSHQVRAAALDRIAEERAAVLALKLLSPQLVGSRPGGALGEGAGRDRQPSAQERREEAEATWRILEPKIRSADALHELKAFCASSSPVCGQMRQLVDRLPMYIADYEAVDRMSEAEQAKTLSQLQAALTHSAATREAELRFANPAELPRWAWGILRERDELVVQTLESLDASSAIRLPDLPEHWNLLCSLQLLMQFAAFQDPSRDDILSAGAALIECVGRMDEGVERAVQVANEHLTAVLSQENASSIYGICLLRHCTAVDVVRDRGLLDDVVGKLTDLAETVGSVSAINGAVAKMARRVWIEGREDPGQK